MKKILCSLLIIACLFLCSCQIFGNTKKTEYYSYNIISKNAECVEIVYDDNPNRNATILKVLNYEESLKFLEEFSQIKFTILSPMVAPRYKKGLNFRVKLLNDLGYVEYSCEDGITICSYDEYYGLIKKYCPDINLEEYLPEEYNQQ
ncbi:MAG: hypothetical protein IJD79_07100 [Clostridia bacterium]|nr:hypothetical protein [Clostridia bacterium]